MTTPNKDNTWCIDGEKEIQMECANCPPCYKWTKEVCAKIVTQISQAIYSGK